MRRYFIGIGGLMAAGFAGIAVAMVSVHRQWQADVAAAEAAQAEWVAERAEIAEREAVARKAEEQKELIGEAMANLTGGWNPWIVDSIDQVQNPEFVALFLVVRAQRDEQSKALDELLEKEPCASRFEKPGYKERCDKLFDALSLETFAPIKPNLDRIQEIANTYN